MVRASFICFIITDKSQESVNPKPNRMLNRAAKRDKIERKMYLEWGRLMPALITAAACGILSLVCLILSVMQFREKGPLLNNAWIWAAKEERITMNKKPHYRQSGVVFAFLAAIFFCIALECVLATGWLLPVAGAFTAAVAVYAIVSSLKGLNR